MTYNLPGLLTRITIYSKNKSDLLHPLISSVVFPSVLIKLTLLLLSFS